jgi:hypothetical protein
MELFMGEKGTNRKDITGNKYGKLTAISFVSCINKKTTWLFKCECGVEKEIKINNVMYNGTMSCGCLRIENFLSGGSNKKHGKSKSNTYRIWDTMKQRCTNPNNNSYKRYGKRGIVFCKRWYKFENFLEDMGEKPKGHTLERINNNLGYNRKNCRWATPKEQARNKRNTVYFEYFGEKKALAQWCEELNIPYKKMYYLLKTKKVDITKHLKEIKIK